MGQMKTPKELKIAVLMGGYSAEREVSLRSGGAAAAALRSLGCEVHEVDVRDKNFVVPTPIDVVFIALHGTGGEDGVIQAILEQKGLPFTGSDSASSRRAFDKVESKAIFVKAGLKIARDAVMNRGSAPTAPISEAILPFPRVIKPSRQGSSIGIHIVRGEAGMASALKDSFEQDDTVLVEEFIDGRELTVGILGERALPAIEIRPKNGWYDYANKYTKGATEYLVPAPIDDVLLKRVQVEALKAHRSLGCRDISRSDFRVDSKGETYILETNTIPGMTETSLLPKAAAAAGISFPQLCLTLVECAMERGRS